MVDARLGGWRDASGRQNDADDVVGSPLWRSSAAGVRWRAAVAFNGTDRLRTTTNFGFRLLSYTVALVARYSGEPVQSRRVLSSVGSDWAVGLAGGSTSSFIAGNTLQQDISLHDNDMHVYVATMTSASPVRLASLWRDGVQVLSDVPGGTELSWAPRILELGGFSETVEGQVFPSRGSACEVSTCRAGFALAPVACRVHAGACAVRLTPMWLLVPFGTAGRSRRCCCSTPCCPPTRRSSCSTTCCRSTPCCPPRPAITCRPAPCCTCRRHTTQARDWPTGTG